MQVHLKLIVAVAAAALASIATAQTSTDGTRDSTRSTTEATRDTANAVGRAASAAVTPGDQNMGRSPENRSGGLMGNDRTSTDPTTAGVRRSARADRG